VLFLSLSLFAEQYGILFLQQVHNFSSKQASVANSMVFLGWLVGAPFTHGWLGMGGVPGRYVDGLHLDTNGRNHRKARTHRLGLRPRAHEHDRARECQGAKGLGRQ